MEQSPDTPQGRLEDLKTRYDEAVGSEDFGTILQLRTEAEVAADSMADESLIAAYHAFAQRCQKYLEQNNQIPAEEQE